LTDFKVASGAADEWLTFEGFCQAVAALDETLENGKDQVRDIEPQNKAENMLIDEMKDGIF